MLADHDSYAVSIAVTSRLSSLGYSGEHFDAKAQQQYLRARFYDPANGRFNRLDPFAGNMQDPQSLHKYAYVHGDPIQGVDPLGEFTMASSLGGMSIGTAMSNPSNDANMSAYGAALAASSAQSPGEFVQIFNEKFQESLHGSLLSSLPIFGTLHDLYELGQSAFSFFGNILDLTDAPPEPSSHNAFARAAAPATRILRGTRGWTASRYFTKLRRGMQVQSVKRIVDGKVDWIPLIGTAQRTSGDHQRIVARLAKQLAKKADTELVAMNRSLSTVLRTVGGTYAPWARGLGVNLYIPVRFGSSAKNLERYTPDMIAIQGNSVIIREVASATQMSGRVVNRDYVKWLESVQEVATNSQLNVRVEIYDTTGRLFRVI